MARREQIDAPAETDEMNRKIKDKTRYRVTGPARSG
jgi:hypothetical protein